MAITTNTVTAPKSLDLKAGYGIDPIMNENKKRKQECEAKGGKWDAVNQVCIMPTEIPKQTEQQPKPLDVVKQNIKQEGGYIDETGKYIPSEKPKTKINFKNDGTIEYTPVGGETLSLSREEYNALQGKSGKLTEKVKQIQAVEGGAVQQVQREQAISQLGLTPEEIAAAQAQAQESNIDVVQAGTAGVAGAAPAALGAAAAGLVAGSGALAATGVGAPIAVGTLAVAGGLYAISKLWTGVTSNIKSQQSGQIGATKDTLAAAKTNMRLLTQLAADNPERAIEVYNQQLAQVYTAQAKLKLETSGVLDRYLDDGTEDLSDFELFLQPNGQAELLRLKIEDAIRSGAPSQFTAGELSYLGVEAE